MHCSTSDLTVTMHRIPSREGLVTTITAHDAAAPAPVLPLQTAVSSEAPPLHHGDYSRGRRTPRVPRMVRAPISSEMQPCRGSVKLVRCRLIGLVDFVVSPLLRSFKERKGWAVNALQLDTSPFGLKDGSFLGFDHNVDHVVVGALKSACNSAFVWPMN